MVRDGQQPSHPRVPRLVRLHPRQPQPEQGGRLRRHRRTALDQRRRVHLRQEHPNLPERPEQHLQRTCRVNQFLSVLKHRLEEQRKSLDPSQLIRPLRPRHLKSRTGQLLQVLPQQIQPLLLTQLKLAILRQGRFRHQKIEHLRPLYFAICQLVQSQDQEFELYCAFQELGGAGAFLQSTVIAC